MKPEDVQLDVEAEKRIAEIREREDKATKGPWTLLASDESPNFTDVYAEDWEAFCHVVTRMEDADEDCSDGKANAVFIAHARQDIPFLLKQLALLRRVSGKGEHQFPQKWSQDAFVILAGLKESVSWELAPEIVQEINGLVEQILATTQGTPEGAK